MKIALAQINTVVGDFAGNAQKVRAFTRRARDAGADLVVFPEQTLCGYPAKDHLDAPGFLAAARRTLDELVQPADWNRGIAVVVGFPEADPAGGGPGLHNSAAFIEEGAIRAVGRKTLLPFYDVFDEPRYFTAADRVTVVPFRGLNLGLSVCEDIWNNPRLPGRRRYPRDPISEMVSMGADVILNLAASPFHAGKPAQRSALIADTASYHGVQVVAVNLVGGNDSLVFDGNSQAFAADGRPAVTCARFEEDLQLFDTEAATGPAREVVSTPAQDLDDTFDALVLGLGDYFRKTGFSKAVLGLSGGMDSSLVACIAAEALGPENVLGILMPSRYSTGHSVDDARALATALGMPTHEIPIEGPFRAFLEVLEPHFEGRPHDLTEENLQARIRGLYLMAFSNKLGHLVLATGNKSEVAVGYATLYGDMAGGLAPLSDVVKTKVYALGRRYNARRGREIIPDRVFTKAPSAELRPDQTDQDSLPEYEVLDPIIEAYVEARQTPAEIAASTGVERAIVDESLRRIVRAEYKRRQMAPGIKVTPRSFGEAWRMPLAQAYEPWED